MSFAFVVAALVAGAGGNVVARVDAVEITSSQLDERQKVLAAQRIAASREQALEQMVDDALFAAEWRRLGLEPQPDVAATLEAQRRRVLTEVYEQKELIAEVKQTDEMLRGVYHDSADSVRLKILTLATREAAQAALERLAKGADFAAEAKSSLDPASAATGGDTGLLVRAQVDPGLVEKVFSVPLGTRVGPVAAGLGWVVAQPVERTIGDEAGFAAKKDSIEAFLRKRLSAHARDQRVAQFRAKGGVKLDEEFLKSLGRRTDASPEELKHPLAVVNGTPLRYGDVIGSMRALASESSHLAGPATKISVAWSEIDARLLAGDAISKGFGEDPGVRATLAPIERNILGNALLDRVRASAAAPSDAQLSAFYQANLARFRSPAKRACSQIFSTSQRDAELLRRRIEKGERFEDVARTGSKDEATAPRGGAVGEISDDELEALARPHGEPALAAALRETPPGQLSGAAKTRLGWFLVKCTAPTPAKQVPLADVRASIVAHLTETGQAAAVDAQRATLRARAVVTVLGVGAPVKAGR